VNATRRSGIFLIKISLLENDYYVVIILQNLLLCLSALKKILFTHSFQVFLVKIGFFWNRGAGICFFSFNFIIYNRRYEKMQTERDQKIKNIEEIIKESSFLGNRFLEMAQRYDEKNEANSKSSYLFFWKKKGVFLLIKRKSLEIRLRNIIWG